MTRLYCCALAEERGFTPEQHRPWCSGVDADLGEVAGDPGDGSLFTLADDQQHRGGAQ